MNRARHTVQHPVKGFLAALGAVAVLSVMDAVMKHLVLALGLFTVSVWRSAANLLFSSVLYLPRRQEGPSRKTLWIHVCRGVDVTVMAGLFFWGIARVPLAQALALTFIAPLIAMLLAPLFLKEKLNARLIGGARWEVLPRAGHIPAIEDEPSFDAALLDFLGATAPGSRGQTP